MANENEILGRLRVKIGLEMNRSSDYDVLAQSIKESTKETLGVNTLKRMFGYKTAKVAPRRSTMDIIARYLGFEDYDGLLKEVGEDADISAFTPVECLEVKDLAPGADVYLTYEPNRSFTLKYLGDFKFIVEGVEGSRNILKGDILTITHLVVGHKFVVAEVSRDGVDLGAYESAKFRGLKSVKLI